MARYNRHILKNAIVNLRGDLLSNAIYCSKCGKSYPDQGTPYQCDCGGFFDIHPDFLVDPVIRSEDSRGIWKYRTSFPLDKTAPEVTLGEGETPLIEVQCKGRTVYLKLEYLNPTGSYKDRGTSVLISFLKSRGVMTAVEDSSGNAGASFAAYSARAGIHARIYVPESASGPKRKQIEAYGAELISIPGPRSEAAKAVLQAARQGMAYGSHAYMPFGLGGIATIAYELYEQLGRVPETVISPIGHGGLLYGIMMGFRKLKFTRQYSQEPFYLGVQAAGCSPVENAYAMNRTEIVPVEESATIAEGVRVSNPARGEAILQHLRQSRGKIIKIEEKDLKIAYFELAEKGFYVEPTSALTWAALSKNLDTLADPIVLILTGSGLKTKSL